MMDNTRQHDRAAAMIEMVMVLPLIIAVLALMWFFGTRMAAVQATEQAARYEAWRQVHRDADEVTASRAGPYDAVDDFAFAVGNIDQPTGEYFDLLLDRFPANLAVDYTWDFDNQMPMFDNVATRIGRDHVRIDRAWWEYYPGLTSYSETERSAAPMHGGNAIHTTVRDQFFEEYDATLNQMAVAGNDWAQVMRDFYLHWPGYQGPDLPEWVNPD